MDDISKYLGVVAWPGEVVGREAGRQRAAPLHHPGSP